MPETTGHGLDLAGARSMPDPTAKEVLATRFLFCTTGDVAFLLGVTPTEVERRYYHGELPVALTREGDEFRPAGKRLYEALTLRWMLDAGGRARFDAWQRDELEIPTYRQQRLAARRRSGQVPAE